jgi:hypothetical protein
LTDRAVPTVSAWSEPVTAITPAEVEKARSWLSDARVRAAVAGAVACRVAEHLDTLDGLVSFAERLLHLR